MNQVHSDVPRKLTILYGSQTGFAQSVAERLYCQARHLFVTTKSDLSFKTPDIVLQRLNTYSPVARLASESGVLLFVCSTTGYGVPPDDMTQFWLKIMHKSLPIGQALPSQLRFAVLGLGDSTYPKYNVVAKKLFRRLKQLGATPLPVEAISSANDNEEPGLGLVDEEASRGVSEGLSLWVPAFWSCLAKILQLPIDPALLSWTCLEGPEFLAKTWPKYNVKVLPHDSNGQSRESNGLINARSADNLVPSKHMPASNQLFTIVKSERLTPDNHFQTTLLMEFEPTDQPVSFEPGDVLFIQPSNHREDIELLFNLTGVDPTQQVELNTLDPSLPLPPLVQCCPSGIQPSARWLATNLFDLSCMPSVFHLANLASFAYAVLSTDKSQDERLGLEYERLLELAGCATEDDYDDLCDYVYRPKRRLVELLRDFPTLASRISVDRWFDLLPTGIRPRPYSIASPSPRLELLLSIVDYQTPQLPASRRRGLASTFLSLLSPGDSVLGWLASNVAGGWRMPVHQGQCLLPPCLLIAPGTGVAPFRSLIQHQAALLGSANNTILLVFGCRYPDKDFYFKEEWKQLEAGNFLRLICAFSRQNESKSGNRVYVQHKLVEHSPDVWSLLHQPNSRVFVVGNAKSLPSEVLKALEKVCQSQGDMSHEQAEAFVARIQTEGRLHVEAWS